MIKNRRKKTSEIKELCLSQTISKSSLLENMYREIIYNFITTTFFIFCQNVKRFFSICCQFQIPRRGSVKADETF